MKQGGTGVIGEVEEEAGRYRRQQGGRLGDVVRQAYKV